MGPEYCNSCRQANAGRQCAGCPEPAIWEENEPAVALFLRCQTQWRYKGMGQRVGLDYAAVWSVLDRAEDPDPWETFERLRVIEREMLNIDTEQLQRANGDQN